MAWRKNKYLMLTALNALPSAQQAVSEYAAAHIAHPARPHRSKGNKYEPHQGKKEKGRRKCRK